MKKEAANATLRDRLNHLYGILKTQSVKKEDCTDTLQEIINVNYELGN